MKRYAVLLCILAAAGLLPACAPVVATSSEPGPASPLSTVHPPGTSSPFPSDTGSPFPTATTTPVPTKIASPTQLASTTATASQSIDPGASLVLVQLADWYYQKGDFEMFIALVKELVSYEQEADQQARFYALIAGGYDKLGDFEKAAQYYRTAYETDPLSAHVANQLCWDYGLLDQAETALPYCEAAVENNPGFAERDSRGLVFALLGNYEAAAADFQVVVDEFAESQDPGMVEIYETRKGWLETLQEGANPITQDVLAELRRTTAAASALPTMTLEESTAGVTGEKFRQAAEEEGFRDMKPSPEDSPLETTEGIQMIDECTARVSWSEANQLVVLASLQMENCSDDLQQGLALWLVDLLLPDKSEKAKACVWSFTDLYSVIEGERDSTGSQVFGGFEFTAGTDSDTNLFFIIAGAR